jgi:hypothetical protein
MDMVHTMFSNSTLPLSMWMEILKTATHIINRVLNKSVPKTHYELWSGSKPSINYFYVWDYPTEVKIFNPQIGKLDPKSESASMPLVGFGVLNDNLIKSLYLC